MIDLSVVVVTWNTRDLVLDCLASLERALEHGADSPLAVETLVVDNGSCDGTAEAVRARYPRARLLQLDRNLGFAAGSNAGIREARGRHILLLNSDALVSPGALEHGVTYLDDNPDVAIVGPQLRNPDGSKQNSIHNYPMLATELVPKGVFQFFFRRHFPSRRWSGEEPIDVQAVTGAALFARAHLVDSIGPLSEDYFFFLEETDWCRSARRVGWRVVHLPSAEVVHLSGGSSKRRRPGLTRIEYHRSLYRFFHRNHGRVSMGVVVALRFVKALFYVLTQTPLAPFVPSLRSRARVHRAVLFWHLRGCPDGVGLGAVAGSDAERAIEAPLSARRAVL